MKIRVLAALVLLNTAAAQVPPAPPKPPANDQPGGVFRIPPQFPQEPKPEPPKPETPATAVIANDGQPMRLPVTCGDEEIVAFGMTCTPQEPCPVFLDLAGFQVLGRKIFVAGNLHNGASTLSSVLLMSDDEGKTWREPVERVRGAGLEQVQFLDFETGWVSGAILGELPRDPFFLLTTDGGVNWRRRPVFGESRVAAIEQFVFESRKAGALLIDRVQAGESGARWELHETMTGGESWMVREVSSKPLKLKTAPPPGNTDWRLRPDNATRSHVIERRTGQRWQRVAAFLIQTGECRPSPQAPRPEPAAEEPAPVTPEPTPAAQPRPPGRPALKKKP